MDDAQAGLHARLVIVDRDHMLVTSANLTYHGLHRNIEIGPLCHGQVAADAVGLLLRLVSSGIIRRLPSWQDS